jgi:adenosine deaminase CECR1
MYTTNRNVTASFLLLFAIINFVACLPLPFNQFSYVQGRNKLKSKYEHFNMLTPKENQVNLYMEYQKRAELRNTSSYFYPSRPIESELEKIVQRPMFNMLKKLPKGGNLHMHETQMLDRTKLLKFILELPEYDYVHICDKQNDPRCSNTNCTCISYQLKYFKKSPAPNGWLKVKGSSWTIDSIVRKTTLINMINDLPEKIYQTDSVARWALAYKSGIFALYDELLRHNTTYIRYLKECLDTSLEEGVLLLELRRGTFGNLFYFDQDGNEIGIDIHEEIKMIIDFKQDYILQNPRFIDFIYIIYGSRKNNREVIKSNLESTLKVQSQYPNLVRGFDIVGEEDLGHTLLFHRETMLNGYNYSLNSNGTFSFNFHTAETNWPSDMEPVQVGDDVSTLDNVFDSILLKTKRVGHGLGFIKYPHLYPYLRNRKIAIEICPTSNQILGKI